MAGNLSRAGGSLDAASLAKNCLAVAVAVSFFYFALLLQHGGASADFMALWLAGDALTHGRPDLVYPADAGYFTMLPPPEWVASLTAKGYRGQVYPYIYPPLWAALAARLSAFTDYGTVLASAQILNPLFLLGMLALARRLVAPRMSLWLYLAIGCGILLTTQIGLIALFQTQPQIFVAFLIVLAIERAEHRAPVTAGIALALAASIKLYPAFYALFWLASGQRRAALVFAVTGAALAALSVLAAGWPLHRDFLHMVHVISDSVMINRIAYALESPLAALIYSDRLHVIAAATPNGNSATAGAWLVLQKPPLFAACFKILQVATLIWLVFSFRRLKDAAHRATLWPVAFALVSLTGPIAWSYHFLSLAAFAPAAAARMSVTRSLAFFPCFIFTLSPFAPELMGLATLGRTGSLVVETAGIMGILSLVALFCGFTFGGDPQRFRRGSRADPSMAEMPSADAAAPATGPAS